MEATSWRIPLTTAIAPIIWGSTYYLTRNFLPPEYPLTAAAIRALPAGLILLAITRKLPHGIWWIRTLTISTLTISGFFILVYISGSKLPSSIASMIMALSPIATMAMAHLLLKEKITPRTISGGILGLLGVFTLLGGTTGHLDLIGLLAAGAGMISSALGFVLTRRWKPPVNATTFTAWQLTIGGMITAPHRITGRGNDAHPIHEYYGSFRLYRLLRQHSRLYLLVYRSHATTCQYCQHYRIIQPPYRLHSRSTLSR